VNDRVQLAAAESLMQARLRHQAMLGGATLIDPASVYFSADTRTGADVTIEPHCVFGPGVEIGDRVTIHAFCHLQGARIEDDAVVGPFARFRPGAHIRDGAKVGNFVEIKQAVVETGAKVNHLTYIGDARVGAGANIGAGTITCNYDGEHKHRTDIGAGAFIGSNSSLIAPVSIGEGAYIGSGSVISKDVPPDALALTRPPLTVREGWRARRRAPKPAAE
jgi:bifunctional UDP-N-acetylglucosamine pyrophosphorylase/glucosamine-1-phosphate N-acetyltransferase